VDAIKNREISFIINTVGDEKNAVTDSLSIRTSALASKVTTYTTIAGARAAVEGMTTIAQSRLEVYDLKNIHNKIQINS
jgi:carbamoyl-phosphate synthase large subunit